MPPGPPGVQDLRAMRADPLGFVTALHRSYGDVSCHRTPSETVYLLGRPDLARWVLKDNGANYTKKGTPDDHMLRPLLGNGLLTSSGAEWAAQRRMCAPAFRPSKVRTFDTVITDATAAMLNRWAPAIASGEPLAVDHQLTSLTLGILVQAILGVDVDGFGQGFGRAVDAVNAFIGHFTDQDSARRADAAAGLLTFTRAKAFLDMVTDTLIAARRGNGSGTHQHDLLGAMMSQGHDISDSELREQVLTLIMAGHETTAKALTWTFYLLDRHPDEQDLVVAEIDRVLGGRTPTAGDIASLPACQRVIKESMRLYPPIWLISRRAIGPDMIDGYPVAPGTLVCLSQWVLHRDERYWPDPDRFRPERFAAPARIPSHAYLPFGGGERVCLGQHFAMVEAVLALVAVLQRVRLRLPVGYRVEPEALVTLRPRTGMPMSAVPR
jgi:cytochrome P450